MWIVIDSPIEPLRLVESEGRLVAIDFSPWRPESDRTLGGSGEDSPVLAEAARQLAEYFAGERTVFDLPLAPAGTLWQRSVWAPLQLVGYGDTVTYGEIAARLGRTPVASRAVGLANGANPIPVVIPCHRVIGADGTLTGYAGGLARKQMLLDLERPGLF